MYYIVVRQPPIYHQMTLDEFLFGVSDKPVVSSNEANTRTYAVERVSEKFETLVDVDTVINKLTVFNLQTEELHEVPRHSLYREFFIPKKSGGLRKIDAPEDDLMNALRRLKEIFETDCRALYHTAAFAYVKKRSTIDAVKRHQKNESKWFLKLDLSNFFGSTTLDFTMKMLGMVYPFSEIIKDENGKAQLKEALELCFLDGGLPQGTPISPLLTNLIMIPVDYKISNDLRSKNHMVYTRYADDFLISSKYDFKFREIENYLVETLKGFDAPFSINKKKTRYGSSAGSNWNLGVMLNKDNKITIGHKRKKQFQAMLSSYTMDKKGGKNWDLSDVQVLEGYRNYYRMVEGESIDGLINHLSQKFEFDIVGSIKADLSAS